MQLRSLFYLASIFSIVVASVAVVQNVIDGVYGLDAKVDSLHGGVDAGLQSGETASVALVLALHKETMDIISATEEITRIAKMCPELSNEEAAMILNALYQMQPMVETGLQLLVDRKAIIDNLPGGRGTAVVGLGLIQMKNCLVDLQNALMDITPVERLPEAHALATQIQAACDSSLAVYNN